MKVNNVRYGVISMFGTFAISMCVVAYPEASFFISFAGSMFVGCLWQSSIETNRTVVGSSSTANVSCLLIGRKSLESQTQHYMEGLKNGE